MRPPSMCGSTANFIPIGRILAPENSNCPTALVPALSSNCAAALSSTPSITRLKLIAFIAIPRALLSHHDDAPCVLRDQPHRQAGGGKTAIQVGLHDGE